MSHQHAMGGFWTLEPFSSFYRASRERKCLRVEHHTFKGQKTNSTLSVSPLDLGFTSDRYVYNWTAGAEGGDWEGGTGQSQHLVFPDGKPFPRPHRWKKWSFVYVFHMLGLAFTNLLSSLHFCHTLTLSFCILWEDGSHPSAGSLLEETGRGNEVLANLAKSAGHHRMKWEGEGSDFGSLHSSRLVFYRTMKISIWTVHVAHSFIR